jgi:hypothetical protein
MVSQKWSLEGGEKKKRRRRQKKRLFGPKTTLAKKNKIKPNRLSGMGNGYLK